MPNFSLIAFASAIETLRLANNVKGSEIYTWETITPTDDVVKASNGLEFKRRSKTPESALPYSAGKAPVRKSELASMLLLITLTPPPEAPTSAK